MSLNDTQTVAAEQIAARLQSLSVVTTTDPHAQNIWKFLDCLNDLATHYTARVSVIIVDDLKLWPSTPPAATFQHFQQLNIQTIWNPEHQGQLAAMLSGMAHVQTEWIATFDPDMYQAIQQLPRMLALADSSNQLVHLARTKRTLSPIRRLGSYLTNWLSRLAMGFSVPDINSPVVLLQRRCMAALRHNTGIQPRLFLYWHLKNRTAVISWSMDNAPKTTSSYNTFDLIRLFAKFFSGSVLMWRYRYHRERKDHD